jgi:1-aminocyclopropane-1-carboxylate deaminase/D-cysteine desulfhydrase-like pyridoxal-dependent ACC family enzyme
LRVPTPARVPLVLLPTPLHRLERLSSELGLDLWIKRDDMTGFALGGNKGRKLEFLMADVLAKSAEVVVACGAAQSNFVRQLGAACAMNGIRCAAAVMDRPYYAAAGKPGKPAIGPRNGNILIDEMLGVEVCKTEDGPWEALYVFQDSVARRYEDQGLRVYKMPIGGSSPLGAYAFALAAREACQQADGFEFLITPSSSGSTHTGLTWHFKGSGTKVIGISADPDPDAELVEDMVELAEGVDRLAGVSKNLVPDDFDLRMDWVGEGYGVPSEEGAAAISKLARTEGIFLDPVYSGKAFAGLLDLAARKEIGGKVLFWHTGGTPALFASNG